MKIRPTQDGGIEVKGAHLGRRIYARWDSEGRLIKQSIEIRTPKSEGLGDTIAKATKMIGIEPCGGCDKRRKILNKFVPYKQ